MFNNVSTNSGWFIMSTDIGKYNRFQYKKKINYSFVIWDEARRKPMITVKVKFKKERYEAIPNDYAYTCKSGELCYPQDQPADTLFQLIFFGQINGEKDSTPERPRYTEPTFTGFTTFKN